jgi:crotonobetainyl-CoA:carnitine CoA-transferase CaiB-like acyl-CoA transferase
VNTIADAVADPHVRARGNVVQAVLESGRAFLTTGVVPKLSESPGAIDFVAPPLGAHNDAVWRGLVGLSAGELEGLRVAGVI